MLYMGAEPLGGVARKSRGAKTPLETMQMIFIDSTLRRVTHYLVRFFQNN